jgi:hypothetical protein
MYDAVVTFVTREETVSDAPDVVYTKVYRLEFESEEQFNVWLQFGSKIALDSTPMMGCDEQAC